MARRFYGKTPSLKDVKPGEYDFVGTVKVHGTHAGVFVDGSVVSAQSRNRVLSAETDNLGTFRHVVKCEELYRNLGEVFGGHVYFWGEYAGTGIQKGVGVSHLYPRMFIYGAELVTGEVLDAGTVRDAVVRLRKDEPVYHVHEFETVSLKMDTREGADAAVAFITEVTARFEEQCPIADFFGVKGVGEGLVFYDAKANVRFKSKGAKHQSFRRPVAVKASKETIDTFVANAVTPSRVEQGTQLHGTHMCPELIRWVIGDIFTEEADVVEASGLSKKDVSKAIATRLREMLK